MNIIELAEKQKNNEILPKHIRYEDKDLYFDGVTYYDKEGNNDFFDILAMNNNALTHLYDEIEIIEEDKPIEKIEDSELEELECLRDVAYFFQERVNELIDIVKELRSKE